MHKLEEQAAKDAEGALQRIREAGEKKGGEVVQILIRGVTEVSEKFGNRRRRRDRVWRLMCGVLCGVG